MGWMLFAAVIALPVAEVMVWVRVAAVIGAGATILLSVVSVLVGLAILRQQGVSVLLDAHRRLERGEMPVAAAFEGLCLSAAGFLLVVPGFLTDLAALALLVPAVRALLWGWLERRLPPAVPPTGPGPVVIEGEFVEVDRSGRHDDPRQPPRG
ncbi:FxsA family protein [Phaeospirillum tilakii]|uniref:FxsA family protein n=1 Tax=Phaeospirillum tilakii TaxID=741673 RepID=A0ABW5CA51_9PROT